MSLSAKFDQSKKEMLQAERAASIATIDRALSRFADGFAGAARKVAARRLRGKDPTWFQKRKTEKWIWTNKGFNGKEFTLDFFEDIPGFRKLRDACADPAMDIAVNVWISSSTDPSIKVSLDPTRPFQDSTLSMSGSQRDTEIRKPGAPAIVSQTLPPPADDKISVMPQLRLKVK